MCICHDRLAIQRLRVRVEFLTLPNLNLILLTPILINGAVVEKIESFKSHGVHITNKLTWSKHTKTVVKRAQQNLFPLRRLKRFGMGPQILKRFYSCTIEASLPGMATAWPLTTRHYRG